MSWLVADLAGLWEVSRVHMILVQNLLTIGDRANNRRRLQVVAQELDVNWFSNATGHIETMRRELARFKDSLYGHPRKQTNRKRRAN